MTVKPPKSRRRREYAEIIMLGGLGVEGGREEPEHRSLRPLRKSNATCNVKSGKSQSGQVEVVKVNNNNNRMTQAYSKVQLQ